MTASAPEPSKPVPAEEPPVPTASCANCTKTIERTYFRANGLIVCPHCRIGLASPPKEGAGLRFWRALGLGVGAGVVGGAIWAAVRAATGYEIGFIAIIVGLLVGGAVRKGANARGGWGYQIMAMLLTYCTIVATYVPTAIQGIDQAAAGQLPPPEGNDSGAAMRAATAVAPSPAPAGPPRSPLPRTLVVIGAILLSFAAPFLSGVMGIVIAGIALYEAWKINKRPVFAFGGPWALGAAASPPPSPSS